MNQINNPKHYQGASPIGRELLQTHLGFHDYQLDMECIDFIEQNIAFSGFILGNAIKYLWRAGSKGDAVADLQKASWYLDRWVNNGDGLTKRLKYEIYRSLIEDIKLILWEGDRG